MPFLIPSDYDNLIKDNVLLSILEATTIGTGTITNPILLAAEQQAQAQMESYLNQRFDVAAIFSATGSGRNPLVIMYLVDLVLYNVHSAISKREFPQIRQDRYELAINWLKMVARGEITPNLPLTTDPATGVTEETFNIFSNPKLNHQW